MITQTQQNTAFLPRGVLCALLFTSVAAAEFCESKANIACVRLNGDEPPRRLHGGLTNGLRTVAAAAAATLVMLMMMMTMTMMMLCS